MLAKALAAIGLAASLALTPATSSTAAATTSAAPDEISIELVTVNGSGCPPGTVGVSAGADNTKLVLTYSNYLAQVGVGAAATDFRKNCQVNFIVHHPAEYTYAVVGSRGRGFASLQAKAYAQVKAGYYFQGSEETSFAAHRINGPLDDGWAYVDQMELAWLHWEPCGVQRNFNINTELRVYAGASDPRTTTSFITMDNLDIDAGNVYDLVWKRCPTS